MSEFVCKVVLNFNESLKFERKFQIWKSFVYEKKFLKIKERFKSERKFHRWEFQIWKKFLIWMKVSYIKKASNLRESLKNESFNLERFIYEISYNYGRKYNKLKFQIGTGFKYEKKFQVW